MCGLLSSERYQDIGNENWFWFETWKWESHGHLDQRAKLKNCTRTDQVTSGGILDLPLLPRNRTRDPIASRKQRKIWMNVFFTCDWKDDYKGRSRWHVETRCEEEEEEQLNICSVYRVQDKSSAGGSSMFSGWKKGQGDHCQEEGEEEDEDQHGWTGGGRLQLGGESGS